MNLWIKWFQWFGSSIFFLSRINKKYFIKICSVNLRLSSVLSYGNFFFFIFKRSDVQSVTNSSLHEAKQVQTIMHPPPCFITGICFFFFVESSVYFQPGICILNMTFGIQAHVNYCITLWDESLLHRRSALLWQTATPLALCAIVSENLIMA